MLCIESAIARPSDFIGKNVWIGRGVNKSHLRCTPHVPFTLVPPGCVPPCRIGTVDVVGIYVLSTGKSLGRRSLRIETPCTHKTISIQYIGQHIAPSTVHLTNLLELNNSPVIRCCNAGKRLHSRLWKWLCAGTLIYQTGIKTIIPRNSGNSEPGLAVIGSNMYTMIHSRSLSCAQHLTARLLPEYLQHAQ